MKSIILRHNTKMSKMTEKELISKLQGLKQIKPRKDWVFLVKSEIFKNNFIENKVINKTSYSDVFSNIFSVIFQRKFAYALAVFLFIFIGISGFMKYNLPEDGKVTQQSPAVLAAIKNNVESFKAKSQNLADIAKNNPQDVSLAVKEVNDAARELINAVQKNPQLAKTIALDVNNNKTYLNIQGGDNLKETLDTLYKASDILYKAIDDPIIASIKETELTKDQQIEFDNILGLYDQGDYSGVLVRLLISFGQDSAEDSAEDSADKDKPKKQ